MISLPGKEFVFLVSCKVTSEMSDEWKKGMTVKEY